MQANVGESMAGLRAQSKIKRRRQILDAAEHLFHAKGYESTRIEEIAADAVVSIGTIYAYFGSKGGIMAALTQPVIDGMKARGEAIITCPPKQAVDAVAAMFEAYRFTDSWKDRKLLEAFSARGLARDAELEAIVRSFDQFITEQLTRLFQKLILEKRLHSTLDPADLTYLVQHLLFSHFEDYAGGAVGIYEEMLVNLHRRLRLMFQNWI